MKALGYIYEHMVRVFPDKPWVKAYSNIYGGGQTPSLPKVMDNFLVQGLYIFEIKHESQCDQYEIGLIKQSMSLCNAFLGMYHSLSGIEQDNCLKRFQAAFHKPNDLRAIDFELFCYIQLRCKNCAVEVKYGDNSDDNFDYLITDQKGLQVQLECKSFAYSKGLYVTGEDAARLYNIILSLEHGLECISDNQLRIYTIELKKQLPKGEESLKVLAEQIICAINDESYVGNDIFCVKCEIFNNVADIEELDRTLDFKSDAVGIEVGRIASLSKGGSGRFSLILNSAVKESALLREFETICKKSAKNQLPNDKRSSIAVEVKNPQVLEYLLGNPRFQNKVSNIFKQKHVTSLILVTNTQGILASDDSHFYATPRIEEFSNISPEFQGAFSLKSGCVAI